MNKTKFILLIIATTLLITACQPDESGKLENRVKAYWQHKINKEFDKAYEFTTPGYKKLISKEAFMLTLSTAKLEWKGMKIDKKQCEKPDLCVVRMLIKYKYKFHLGGFAKQDMEVETPLSEKWILSNNTWYVVQK